jgi:hypothetical protein
MEENGRVFQRIEQPKLQYIATKRLVAVIPPRMIRITNARAQIQDNTRNEIDQTLFPRLGLAWWKGIDWE